MPSIFTKSAALALALVSGADAFWRIGCDQVQLGRVDPIISPGGVSAHSHSAVGSPNFGVSSTPQSVSEAECSTCVVQADKSAYWSPNLYYQYENGSFVDVPGGGAIVYYLGRGPNKASIKPFPKGLQMISGNPFLRSESTATTWNGARKLADRVSFNCLSSKGPQPEQNYLFSTDCDNGLRAQIHFPACWDGVNLYKSDQSHMAYLSSIDNGVCPPTHPIQVPNLFIEWFYSPNNVAGQTSGGRFTFAQGDPTGYGFHADFQNGWDQDVLTKAVDNCLYNEPSYGTIQECPFLMDSYDSATGRNCPKRASVIGEAVTGILPKLPGCNPVTPGPADAPRNPTDCPTATSPPAIAPTKDSSVRPTNAPTTGESYGLPGHQAIGCVADTPSNRTLKGGSTSSDNMNVVGCQNYCRSRGFKLSGVEYGRECWCGNEIKGIGATNATAKCDYRCSGTQNTNGIEICGGWGAMNIYSNNNAGFTATGKDSA